MSTFRSVLLSLFAVLAVSAVASASASALVYLVGNMEVLAGEKFLTLSEQTGNAVLKSTGADVEVTCAKNKGTGFIESGGASLALNLFAECTVQKPSTSCKVIEPVHLEAVGKLVTEGGITLDAFKPVSGTKFAELEFTSCSLEKIEVEGMTRADVETLTMELTNKLKFLNNAPTGLLEVGGKNGTFTLEENVDLCTDEKWGIRD